MLFLVFSFQESTAQAFANDRMIADGDVFKRHSLVALFKQMEALILPKLIANLAVKRYPTELTFKRKFTGAKKYLSQSRKNHILMERITWLSLITNFFCPER